MKVMIRTWAVVIILFFCACRGERWDDDLTLPKQNYDGDQLRMDGYFYSYSDNDYQIYFLYRNGTVLKSPFISSENLYSSEQEFANGIFYNHAIKRKYYWGRFIINGTTIKNELWKPNTGPFEAYTTEGIILNDTTFKMTKSYRSCKPKKDREFETLYHFKQFSPKPDSTNSYTN
jgi:hypothetical protein